VAINAFAAADKIVIGHSACLSGKYAKAGEQAIGGIKACIDWVNNVHGGVLIAGKESLLIISTMIVNLKRGSHKPGRTLDYG